jgi:hypothetical protein
MPRLAGAPDVTLMALEAMAMSPGAAKQQV